MSLRVDIENFRILRNVHMDDEGKLSVLVGYNESGKTSFINAIKFAFVGEALGYRGKAIAGLVTHGETKLSVRVRVGNHYVSRTTTSGDSLKATAERMAVPVDVMPLLFDAKMCGDGGNKHLLAFLNGVASSRFDPAVRFINDPDVIYYINRAKQFGKVTTKQMLSFMADARAQQKTPTAPMRPDGVPPTVEQLEAKRLAVDLARKDKDKAELDLNEVQALGLALDQIANHTAALAAYETRRLAAASGDTLQGQRDALTRVANINLSSLESILSILEAGRFETGHLQSAVADTRRAIESAKATLAAHPLPPSMPTPPVLPAGAQAIWNDLAGGGSTVDRDTIAEYATLATSSIATNRATSTFAKAAFEVAEREYNALLRQSGAWTAYEKALPEHDNAVQKTEVEWARWDAAIKAVEAAEAEHIATQGDGFAKMVSEMGSYILQGRAVRIDPEQGIFLGPTKIDDLSESTKWRVEVAVMAAVARSLKSPLLLLDGADILDVRNRALVTQFLLERIVPYFDHVVLTMTAREELTKELAIPTPGVCKYLIENGGITKLAAPGVNL